MKSYLLLASILLLFLYYAIPVVKHTTVQDECIRLSKETSKNFDLSRSITKNGGSLVQADSLLRVGISLKKRRDSLVVANPLRFPHESW